jgi:hypothetical protein
MQIDAEKWPYDPDAPGNVLAFASLLARSGLPGWKVTYASRGQYAGSLTGIATPLWNASYGANTGTYPGDSYSGWAAYSGQTPVLLQYGSKPYDRNAFRGSLAELLALTGGDDDMDAATEAELMRIVRNLDAVVNVGLLKGEQTLSQRMTLGDAAHTPVDGAPFVTVRTLAALATPTVDVDALAAKVAAALVASNANGLTPADHAGLVEDVKTALRAGTGS